VPDLVKYGSLTSVSAWVKPMDIKRASVSRVLAPAKVEAVKELKEH
jgi:hypothetical protein